ncbi:hypothetical protein BCR35DRAFT_307649 [Leucosporidium creatinivorum]|uniref:Uncharacterized protein n=1 Tax=Leucosporidium creatinivorum TaxID=106004 RepID=A0A1Y2ELG2_9BASI|nr:hypothetical protein BCR35DRAFT_307649 [Leucosporidium creatinivorum]
MEAPPNPFKLTLRLGQQATAPTPSTLPQQLASSAASVATLSPASEFDDPMTGGGASGAGAASDAGSTTATPLPSATLGAAGQAPPAGVGSTAPSVVAAGGAKAAAAAAGAKVPGEKPKRKRAPKRPPGEPGPGKAWRKGLKGTLAAGTGAAAAGASPARTSPSVSRAGSTAGGAGPSTPSGGGAGGLHAIGSVPKIATSFLPPLALDVRTPRPRRWSVGVKELKSVTGATLKFRSWRGASSSAYAESRRPPSPTPRSLPTSPPPPPPHPPRRRVQEEATRLTTLPLSPPLKPTLLALQPPPRSQDSALPLTLPLLLNSLSLLRRYFHHYQHQHRPQPPMVHLHPPRTISLLNLNDQLPTPLQHLKLPLPPPSPSLNHHTPFTNLILHHLPLSSNSPRRPLKPSRCSTPRSKRRRRESLLRHSRRRKCRVGSVVRVGRVC